jgi:hypothetical protein
MAHKPRGKVKFTYTYDDISRATGISYVALRKMVSRGVFNPRDLVSVAYFFLEEEIRKMNEERRTKEKLNRATALSGNPPN